MLDKLSEHYQKGLPFVSFRKPKDNQFVTYLVSSDRVEYSKDFTESGFVFAPFDDQKKPIIFRSSHSEIVQYPWNSEIKLSATTSFKTTKSSPKEHIQLVEKAIQAIKDGDFRKVVISRQEILQIQSIDIIQVYANLLQEYPNAFSYIWYHPKVGLWIGATPERLVSLKDNTFITMALAGTQLYQGNENPDWGMKEITEHQYVVDYIVEQIKDPTNGIVLSDFQVSDTYTSKAGNLLHLKANIQGTIGQFKLKELLQTLHPTPAVCGLPKEKAKEFILKNENYHRGFYTGFLGEINIGKKTELFVNLRCAEYHQNTLTIYVGGGVTEESNAQKEWEETLAKTQTIKSVL